MSAAGMRSTTSDAKDPAANAVTGIARLDAATGNLIYADGIRVSIHGLDDLIVVANGREVMIMPRGSSQNVRNFAKDSIAKQSSRGNPAAALGSPAMSQRGHR